MRVDEDEAAVFFVEPSGDFLELLRAALGAREVQWRTLVWVTRVDLSCDEGRLAVFLDQDGSCQLEMLELSRQARRRVIERLEKAGFAR